MEDCCRTNHEDFIHLPEAELDKIHNSWMKAHVDYVQGLQKKLEELRVCEGDFLTILATFIANITAETIKHVGKASQLNQQQAFNMIIGRVAELVGVQLIAIHVQETKPKNVTAH